MKRIIYSFAALFFILSLTYIIISYGKGYRFDLTEKTFTSTGILSLSSYPEGASVWIDDKLTTATNASLSLSPGWYDVRIGKNGYTPWEKSMRVQGEVVSRADALLIRTNPSLRALTDTGVHSPILSPSGAKIAYLVTDEEASQPASIKPKTGVWVFDLKSGPLGGISEPKQIYQTTRIDWMNMQLVWSPDEKQILLIQRRMEKKKELISWAIQISTENPNILPVDVTFSASQIQQEWSIRKKVRETNVLSSIATPAATLFNRSVGSLAFSPDETKILYQATTSATLVPVITPPLIGTNPTEEIRTISSPNYYIYDIKEDKNYMIGPATQKVQWHTDSKHIIMIEKDTIYIVDYDGTNKRTAYGGPFADNILFPSPNGVKLIILTSLNRPEYLPNLYEIDLQ